MSKEIMDMASKKRVMKILEALSLHELHETRCCIDDLIAQREASGTKSQKEIRKIADTTSGKPRQERFYDIFTCKLKMINELRKPAFLGTVVDISKSGVRLKTKKKIPVGSLLVVFPEKKEGASVLAISPEYDHISNKVFVEVLRTKEVMEMSEIGCKFLPQSSLLFNIIV